MRLSGIKYLLAISPKPDIFAKSSDSSELNDSHLLSCSQSYKPKRKWR